MDGTDAETDKQEELPRVKFHYVKSHNFRVIHADGVFGGMTPRGDLNVGIFSERLPFPDLVVTEIDQPSREMKEVARSGSEGIVREIEAAFIMNIDVAEALMGWLGRHIKEIKRRYKEAEDEGKAIVVSSELLKNE